MNPRIVLAAVFALAAASGAVLLASKGDPIPARKDPQGGGDVVVFDPPIEECAALRPGLDYLGPFDDGMGLALADLRERGVILSWHIQTGLQAGIDPSACRGVAWLSPQQSDDVRDGKDDEARALLEKLGASAVAPVPAVELAGGAKPDRFTEADDLGGSK